jgi:hypothetical protein
MPGARVGVGPGLRELPRTPCMRSSQNSPSRTFVNKGEGSRAPKYNLHHMVMCPTSSVGVTTVNVGLPALGAEDTNR